MSRVQREFRRLDDLVLDLKGLVLVRRYREQSGAGDEELAMFSEEIERVRERLADVVRFGDAEPIYR